MHKRYFPFDPLCKSSLLKCLLLLLLLTASYNGWAQQAHRDSLHVQKLLGLGQEAFDRYQYDSATYYNHNAGAYARKIGYKKGILAYLIAQSKVLVRQNRFKESLAMGLEAVEMGKKLGQRELTSSYLLVGHSYLALGNLEETVASYLSAMKIAQTLGDTHSFRKTSTNLAIVFYDMGEYEKCFQYASESYQLAKQLNDSSGMAYSLIPLALSQLGLKHYDKAYTYCWEHLQLAKKIKDPNLQLNGLKAFGEIEIERKNYQNALSSYQQALQILHYFPSPVFEMFSASGMCKAYFHLKLYGQAKHYLDKGIVLSKTLSIPSETSLFYELGSQIHEQLNNPQMALEYRKKYQQLNDSLLNAETQQNIHRMEIEYQTTQKEKAIAQQKLLLAQNHLEIQKKTNLIYLSLVAVIALFSGICLFYMRYRNKQRSNAQRLRVLNQESELKVLMAMIEGEEKERSRLARELHDGVGGILSATKMHLSVLQQQADGGGQLQRFSHTASMLDAASQEVRTIAHNLSSDMLLRYELEQALEQFCASVSNPSLQVDFYYLGQRIKLKNNFKLVLYRMVQELVHNIIKHAGATQALVQLSLHDQQLSLMVEDNGKGFELKESNGLGLANLQARVRDMQGEISIQSAPGKGTTVYAEFDVKPYLEKSLPEETAV